MTQFGGNETRVRGSVVAVAAEALLRPQPSSGERGNPIVSDPVRNRFQGQDFSTRTQTAEHGVRQRDSLSSVSITRCFLSSQCCAIVSCLNRMHLRVVSVW